MSERYYFTTGSQSVDATKLDRRLRIELELPIVGVSDELAEYQRVAVDFEGEATQDQLALVTAEIAAHDPTDYAALISSGAEAQARSIPGWARWTEDQALAWLEANIENRLPVSNLSNANAILSEMAVVIRAMVRMVITLRNKTFPNLQGQ